MGYEDKDCKNKCRAKRKAKKDKVYDKTKRNRESRAFYDSSSWKRMRSYILKKYNGICLYSLYVKGKVVKADLVHHIEEIKENKSLALDESNLITLCNEVHSHIHANYTKDKKALLRELTKKYERGEMMSIGKNIQ